jgi:gliding motility-associated-like protein
VTPISCNDANDASIDLNLTGGIAPITVLWNDDPSAGIQRNNLSPGSYKVKIIDSDINQCPIEETFIITNPSAISVTSVVTDATDCKIENSGNILLNVSGGTPPYSFMWNTGQTKENLNNIPAGDYAVKITDKNGCFVRREFNIYRQEPLNITFKNENINNCSLKSVSQQTEALVMGGFYPYSYSWSGGIVSGADNNIMTTSQNGSYTLTVTDNRGCEKSKSFLVSTPTIGDEDFRYNALAIEKYDLLSIQDPIQFTNLSTGDFIDVKWDFGDGSAISKEENPIHTYDSIGTFIVKLTIEYETGCTYTFERTLEITLGYSLIVPTAFTPNGDGFNETIRPKFNGFMEIEMNILDSWGTLIYFEKGTTLKGWDGLIKGEQAANGNYIMVVKGLTFYKKEITSTTPVTLLK